MNRHHHAITVLQAAAESASLARLTELARDSSARLQAVETLIPTTLRGTIKAGPINGDVWCLLVSNTSAAAKLRQLVPALETALKNRGWKSNSIRIKVHGQTQM
jgi:hypothetical protein